MLAQGWVDKKWKWINENKTFAHLDKKCFSVHCLEMAGKNISFKALKFSLCKLQKFTLKDVLSSSLTRPLDFLYNSLNRVCSHSCLLQVKHYVVQKYEEETNL